MSDPTTVQDGPGSPERSGGERSEQPRSAGEPGRARGSSTSNEVDAKPTRRKYPNAFKLRICAEAEACETPGR